MSADDPAESDRLATGAVDPIAPLAEIAESTGIWLHGDGALRGVGPQLHRRAVGSVRTTVADVLGLAEAVVASGRTLTAAVTA